MPAKVRKKKGKFRVVHGPDNLIVKNKGDQPVDGGGHVTGTAAERQARAINRSKT